MGSHRVRGVGTVRSGVLEIDDATIKTPKNIPNVPLHMHGHVVRVIQHYDTLLCVCTPRRPHAVVSFARLFVPHIIPVASSHLGRPKRTPKVTYADTYRRTNADTGGPNFFHRSCNVFPTAVKGAIGHFIV